HVKVYVDSLRVATVPQVDLARGRKLWVKVQAIPDQPVLLGNLRIAAGGRALYDALATSGRAATQGIYFDTGSDRIRGESSGTLKEIATMLQEHADLNLLIEGHTDNVGAAAANQTLSEKRAAAVKAALVSTYGIDAARLAAKGFGASKPAAPNTTPEGRQTNRRVELVKQ
ncbi:MAG TPA: OmpA family protein, partial [Gemmatimonadales bacterium]|nr:OmpA family protein [Gemmatimonadales bacterium]